MVEVSKIVQYSKFLLPLRSNINLFHSVFIFSRFESDCLSNCQYYDLMNWKTLDLFCHAAWAHCYCRNFELPNSGCGLLVNAAYKLAASVNSIINPFTLGWQGWPSGESTCLPPMWPGFDFRTRCHKCIEFVGPLLCHKRFFPGYSGFPLSSKTNIWFDLICE